MAALVRHDVIAVSLDDDLERIDGGVAPLALQDVSAVATPVAGDEILRLYEALDQVAEHNHPRTARLLARGRRKIAQKLIEEAAEIALQATRHRSRAVVRKRRSDLSAGGAVARLRHRTGRRMGRDALPRR